jgi:nicotinamidase/pyrazinamidase
MERLVFWDVDTQRDFMEPAGALYVDGAESLISNLARLTTFARHHGITIVASACDHTRADPEISMTPDFRRTFPPHCLRGSRGQEKIAATRLEQPIVIENRPPDPEILARCRERTRAEILIKKHALDVFSNPATLEVLRALAPTRVVVYGVAEELCVHMVITRLVDLGYTVSWAADATRAIDPAAGARCRALWIERGVVRTTTADVVAGRVTTTGVPCGSA